MARIKVTVERIDGYCNNPLMVGDHFFIEGSKIIIPDGKHMCIWALQSMMPVFPVMSERDQLNDKHWVKSIEHFVCPDPKGRVLFKLEFEDDKN